jgi:hypothetical protein
VQPKLTVGLIAGELRERAALSLRHLLAQSILDQLEIIVVDLNPESGPLDGSEHPRVRYLRNAHLRYYCEAQAELVKKASAPLVAFVEDHCYAVPRWAEAVLAAFEDPGVVGVSYTFTDANDGGPLSRAILLAEYGLWMAPHPGGDVRIASSTNIAYRKDALLRHTNGEASIFEAEFLVHRALREEGGRIIVAPRATVAHESWGSLWDACLANGANKRVLASRRADAGDWGPLARIAWAGGMLLVPALDVMRLGWSLRRRRPLWPAYLIGLPSIISIFAYSSWSEALGYLFGAGDSRDEFRKRELAIVRNE